MELRFRGDVIYWRGPAPWHYVACSEPVAAEIAGIASAVTYGWGCIPVTARIGDTVWETSLFPKDGGYLVPVKTAVRKAEQIELGDVVEVTLNLAT